LLAAFGARAESPQPGPDFREVYDLIREHLAGVKDAELNRTAVQALLSALGPKVTLVGDPSHQGDTKAANVTKQSLFDGAIAYVRVGQVGDALDQAVRQAWQELERTNKLNGLVIDLRYAGGSDYAAAVATADLFVTKQQPLLDWGQGVARSREKADAIGLPLAVLVNGKTAAAAEALAAMLRETGVGLILGNRTAGEAMIAQEYPLKDGERLRIATTPIQLGDGSALSEQGLKPDIAVPVSAEDERAYYGDAFKQLAKAAANSGVGSTNLAQNAARPRRPRFNEAELVRERREGLALDSDFSPDGNDSEKPVVRDPVLARALDFLKGLSVMRQTRS
jgi:C-terminal processing protease CtpA/Prc